MENTEYVLPTHIIAAGGIVINENNKVLLVKNNRRGWEFPGGIIEVGENVIDGLKREIMEETGIDVSVDELFCITSNTNKYAGYNGVKEVPTKLLLDFICTTKGGTPRPSVENSETAFFSKEKAIDIIQAPAISERFKAYMEYTGRPIYMEYVTNPCFYIKIKRLV